MKHQLALYLRSYKNPENITNAQIRDFLYSKNHCPWNFKYENWKKDIRALKHECLEFTLPCVPFDLIYVPYDVDNESHNRYGIFLFYF